MCVSLSASDSDQDAAVRLEQERAEIVAKYAKVGMLSSAHFTHTHTPFPSRVAAMKPCRDVSSWSSSQGKEATVEPWEDTDFSLYKVIDRFGFVQ